MASSFIPLGRLWVVLLKYTQHQPPFLFPTSRHRSSLSPRPARIQLYRYESWSLAPISLAGLDVDNRCEIVLIIPFVRMRSSSCHSLSAHSLKKIQSSLRYPFGEVVTLCEMTYTSR